MARSADTARTRFAALVAGDNEEFDLGEAALLIAALEYPRLDVASYIEKLDHFSDLARESADSACDALGVTLALNSVLFEDLGFCGNRTSYYDPRNSFLNDVIDRRTGIPITLSVIYIEVARRIGLAVNGVGMPWHFIVKHNVEGRDIFIDPFNGGRLMDAGECKELLTEIAGGKLELQPEHLATVTKKQILTRMLANLQEIYARGSDYHRALSVVEYGLLIEPDLPAHFRDRGLLLAALDKCSGALAELQRYLAMAPCAEDANIIRERMKTLRQDQARWN